MKRFAKYWIIGIVVLFLGCETVPVEKPSNELPDELNGVKHFKQSTIRIEKDLIVYFDPYQVADALHDADVIFITHSHEDHFSPDDIAKVKNDDTIIVVPLNMEQSAKDLGFTGIKTVEPGLQYTVKGLEFETTFAYNDGIFIRHPKANKWVGYIVNIASTRYYICGDTNFVPELESLQADVVFLNVGGGGSMNPEEAASLAASIQPQIAIPIHYGFTTGTVANAQQFVESLGEDISGYIYSNDGELL